MSLDVLLLLLRVISALLLLGFIGALFWFMMQDLRLAQRLLSVQTEALGVLELLPLTAPADAADGAAEDGADGVTDALTVGTRFPLLPVTRIGRATVNTIVLEDDFASGEHALLVRRGNQWFVEDLQSRNGTLLNDAPLTETAVVTTGDVITIGKTRLMVRLDSQLLPNKKD